MREAAAIFVGVCACTFKVTSIEGWRRHVAPLLWRLRHIGHRNKAWAVGEPEWIERQLPILEAALMVQGG